MALLFEAVETKKFDTRMVERNVARGVVSSNDVEASLKSLPDDTANATWISVETLAQDGTGEGASATRH